jgi:hypothetical protein
MERQRVRSESIRSVGYDPEKHTLEIEFTNSGLYKYFDVPDTVYTSLMRARSKGAYVNDYVRDRFDYKKLR